MRNWQLPAQVGKPQRYEVIVESWLDEGETIDSALWSAPASVTVSGQNIAGNAVSAVLNASVADCQHVITVTLTTNGGNVRQFSYGLVAVQS